MSKFDVPILLIAFNRPKYFEQLLIEVKKKKPTKLYIAIDGPRKRNDNDFNCVHEVVRLAKNAQKNMNAKLLIREKNLGCKEAVATAIDWFFDQVDEGIILEDDCIPNDSFFEFCKVLLSKYRNDTRVMMISGTNFTDDEKIFEAYSYAFGKGACIWGWATWRRAWDLYEKEMESWPNAKKEKLISKTILYSQELADFLSKYFDKVYKAEHTWDFQWFYSRFINGLDIVPTRNMVKNIGFESTATHTKEEPEHYKKINQYLLDGKIKHPKFIYENIKVTMSHFLHKLPGRTNKRKIINFIKRIMGQK